MDSDLLAVARTLAERGWLPGIEADQYGVRRFSATSEATEADLYLAAHNYITDPKRGWAHSSGGDTQVFCEGFATHEPGTDTLALLKCLLQAMEKSCKTS